jgi:hypothetical protein
MKIKELFETKNTNIMIVDCQPGYQHYCDNIMYSLCDFLNNQQGKIIALFNGYGLTDDSKSDVVEYYMNFGLEPDKIEEINFIEKEYGFLRSWMDQGVDDHTILKVIRSLKQHNVNDSRQLDLNSILDENEIDAMNHLWKYSSWDQDPIFLPDFMTINQLRNISPFYMAGGGRNECLREIELICNTFNIRFKRIEKFIYG